MRDTIHTAKVGIEDVLEPERSEALENRFSEAAKQAGETTFSALCQEQLDAIKRLVERGATALRAPRRAIERVGLPEVHRHRFRRCDADEAELWREIEEARQIMPEIQPLLLMQVAGKVAL